MHGVSRRQLCSPRFWSNTQILFTFLSFKVVLCTRLYLYNFLNVLSSVQLLRNLHTCPKEQHCLLYSVLSKGKTTAKIKSNKSFMKTERCSSCFQIVLITYIRNFTLTKRKSERGLHL